MKRLRGEGFTLESALSMMLIGPMGHKSEVTGTLSGGGRRGGGAGATTGGTTPATGTGTTTGGGQGRGGMRSMTVTSIKMISGSCSSSDGETDDR